MRSERKQGNQNMVNLAVDLIIFLIFLVVEAPKFSGLPAHEWLGIAIGAGALTHVLLHWSWVIEISKRFFGKAQTIARVNYVLRGESVYPAGCATRGPALAVVREPAAALARHARRRAPYAVSVGQVPGLHIVSLLLLNNL
jgi:hypothetical protein